MAHAMQRGSLVFDVGSFHPTSKGHALFRAREHVRRFLRSTEIVGLEVNVDEATLVKAAADVARASHAKEGLVRWSAFFEATEPDLVPKRRTAHVAVAVQILEDPPGAPPVRVATFDDARKAAPAALSPEAKVAGAYIGPMMARRRAVASGADEIVLLDVEGNIAEGPTCNAFAVVESTLWTPPLTYVLPGITRDAILAIARIEGIPLRVERLSREAFVSADEAFLSATSFPIAPIASIDGRALAANRPITDRLTACLAAAQAGSDSRFSEWLHFL